MFRDALKAKYTSLEDAIKGYMKNDGEEWHEYAVIEFSKEELLCGEIVFGANMKKGKKLEWKKLK